MSRKLSAARRTAGHLLGVCPAGREVLGGARGSQMPAAVKPVSHFGLFLGDTSSFFVACHLAWIRVTDLWVSRSGNETKMTQGRETAGNRNFNLSPTPPYYQLYSVNKM